MRASVHQNVFQHAHTQARARDNGHIRKNEGLQGRREKKMRHLLFRRTPHYRYAPQSFEFAKNSTLRLLEKIYLATSLAKSLKTTLLSLPQGGE